MFETFDYLIFKMDGHTHTQIALCILIESHKESLGVLGSHGDSLGSLGGHEESRVVEEMQDLLSVCESVCPYVRESVCP